MNKAFKAVIAGAGLALTMGGLAVGATAAHAATVPSVTTPIINDYATTGANPGNTAVQWANDNFSRTLSFTQQDSSVCQSAFNQTSFSSNDLCYTATIADTGTFTTLDNALQPNQGSSGSSALTTGKTIQNIVSGNFTGGESWTIETTDADLPDSSLVQTSTLNDDFNADPSSVSPQDATPNWYNQAFGTPLCKIYTSGNPCGTVGDEVLLNKNWSWTYTTNCGEQWTDAGQYGLNNNGFGGQSSPTSLVGNITGLNSNCSTSNPTGPITITGPSAVGDYVNGFSNGFDVRGQGAWANNQIIGWTAFAGDTDPAVHFLTNPESGGFSIEYAPNGSGDGLCISNPGDNLLVLRNCNGSVWQRFYTSGGYVRSAVNNGYVNPDGKGAQLSVGGGPTPWGGSKYSWVNGA